MYVEGERYIWVDVYVLRQVEKGENELDNDESMLKVVVDCYSCISR